MASKINLKPKPDTRFNPDNIKPEPTKANAIPVKVSPKTVIFTHPSKATAVKKRFNYLNK